MKLIATAVCKLAFVLLLITLIPIPCRCSDKRPSANTSILTGVGTPLLDQVSEKWAQPYSEYSSYSVVYHAWGNNTVVSSLINRKADFGASTALSLQSLRTHRLVQAPWIACPIVITYNLPTLSKPLRLTPSIIADIYLGHIRKWNDPRLIEVNPGEKLPTIDIMVLRDAASSSMTEVTDRYLRSFSPHWRKYRQHNATQWPIGYYFNRPSAWSLSSVIGGICFTTLSYALYKSYSCAKIKNSAGEFIMPDMASVHAAVAGFITQLKEPQKPFFIESTDRKSYPIIVVIYFVSSDSALHGAQRERLLRFLRWTSADGKQIANEASLDVVPISVIEDNLR